MKKPDTKPRSYGLPKLNRELCQAIEDYITNHYGSKRPPTFAAAILALVVELDARDQAWPSRPEVAAHVGCSVWGVDNCLNAAMQRELITKRIRTAPGNNQGRENVLQIAVYEPTRKLLGALPKKKIVNG